MDNGFSDIKVLAVDDSVVQRDYLVSMCMELGVEQIEPAENGQDALDKLRESEFDLVFIDLEMPVMDGVELARHIAAEKLSQNIIILSSKDPVLILSVGTMAESDGLTVLGTLKKPAQLEQIECSLQRLLNTEDKTQKSSNITEFSAEDLNKAIDCNEITLHYQPKLTVKGLLVKGVEALARWQHPTAGYIPPSEFVTIAERFGLIDRLTYYLYEQALEHKKEWQKYGANFHLAFNLSPLSLSNRNLADHIFDITDRYEVAPSEIVLEITENAVSGEISAAIETLAKLRLRGFEIAIDDYGTGFANAQQLSRVPATELKIDRSLVDGVATRPQQQAILRSTYNLANELNLKTVAEGVEHKEDLKFLQETGVDLVQGYLMAKPMKSDDLLQWIKSDLTKTRKDILKDL